MDGGIIAPGSGMDANTGQKIQATIASRTQREHLQGRGRRRPRRLEGIFLCFVLHVPAGHEAQFRIDALRQPDQRSFVPAAPSLQQICDFLGARVDGKPRLLVAHKKYTGNVAAFGRPLPPVAVEGEQLIGMITFPNGGKLMNAKDGIMKRSTVANALTIAAATVLALGMAPGAKANDKGCSNATLSGSFSQKGTGVIISPAAIAGPIANVGTLTFDGLGAVTGALINSLNGTIAADSEGWRSAFRTDVDHDSEVMPISVPN